MGGSAADAMRRARCRAAAHAWRWPGRRTPSRWAGTCIRRRRGSEPRATASAGRRREVRAECGSLCWLGDGFAHVLSGRARGIRPCLIQDTHDLGFKFREFDCEHGTPGMEDQIDAGGDQAGVAPQGFAHAALDAVTLVRLAEHAACGEAYAAGA